MAYLDFNNFIQGAKAAADMNRSDANAAQNRRSQQLIDARAEGQYGLQMMEAVPKAQSRLEDFTGTQAALADLGSIREAVANLKNLDGSRPDEQQVAKFVRDRIQALNKNPGMQSDIARTSYLQGLDGTAAALAQRFAAGSGVAQATAQDLGVGRDYVQVVRNLQELNDPDKIAQNMTRFGFTQIGKPEEGIWQDANGRTVSAFDFLRAKAATAANDMANTMPIMDADRANQLTRQVNMLNASNVLAYDQTPGVMNLPTYTGQGVLTVNRAVAEAVAAAKAAGATPAQVEEVAKQAETAAVQKAEASQAELKNFAPWAAFLRGGDFNDPFSRALAGAPYGPGEQAIKQTPSTYGAESNKLREIALALRQAEGIAGDVDRGLNFVSGGYLRGDALANNPEVLAQLQARRPEFATQAQQLWAQHKAVAEFTQQAEQALQQQELRKSLNLPGVAPLVAPYGLELDQRWLERLRAAGVVAPQGTPDPRPGADARPMW